MGAVYFSVNAFYKISTSPLDHYSPSKIATRQVITPKETPYQPLTYYQVIIERNLFDTETETDQQPEKLDLEALEPTDLKLKLLGTVAGDKNDTYAVIEEAGKRKQNLYRIGDKIQTATVKMILREKVILNVNGKDEVLGIEKVSESRKTSGYSKKLEAFTKTPQKTTSKNITLKRSQIDTAVKDINGLMKQIRIRPHFTNGEPDGLRLTGIRPNSIFYKMGLKSGDIITAVDGKDIESVDDALEFYKSLQSSSKVQLKLKRRNRLQTLDYNIE